MVVSGALAERILVTGGAGFIGSHVVQTLERTGYQVRVFDNFASGRPENLAGTCPEIVPGDVRDVGQLEAALDGVAAVVHLAAAPSVAASMADPVGTHAVNYVGTLNVLEAMRKRGVRRLLYASSAAVYGNGAAPHDEEEAPHPLSPYGLDKLAGEHALRIYGEWHGLHATALRFFNVYGPRQAPDSPYSGVISIFVSRLIRGELLTVFGEGHQSRDFVYVGDVAQVIVGLLPDPQAPTLANVATGRSVTLLELIQVISRVVDRLPQVRHEARRPGDIQHSRASAERLRVRGLRPETSLEAGLRELVASLAVASGPE